MIGNRSQRSETMKKIVIFLFCGIMAMMMPGRTETQSESSTLLPKIFTLRINRCLFLQVQHGSKFPQFTQMPMGYLSNTCRILIHGTAENAKSIIVMIKDAQEIDNHFSKSQRDSH